VNTVRERRHDRRYGGRHPGPGDTRNDFRRDRDRILYSSAFRRLSGITQVVSPSSSHPTHNRLTHSLEVAQISRSIAERLLELHDVDAFDAGGGLDPDAAEAAALAHDLGHPPFGHVAESTLNDMLIRGGYADGFEGNAQSFRIVNVLSTRYKEIEGLNLTRATLAAMSKYPWTREAAGQRSAKWGSYTSEADILTWSREHLAGDLAERKTVEADIMDWSDDFAYAVHDLEDFFRVGLIPLDLLSNSADEREHFLEHYARRNDGVDMEQRADMLEDLVALFPSGTYRGDRLAKATLRSLTSILIDRFVSSVAFDEATARIRVPDEIAVQVDLLKGVTRHYVMQSRALITTRYGYGTIIAGLYRMLLDAATSSRRAINDNLGILPDFYQERVLNAESDAEVARTVADTIASLTEAQAIGLYQRLTGESLGAVLDPIL
jgi:dGTPase